jgi:DNA-binding response OmpR family regulator
LTIAVGTVSYLPEDDLKVNPNSLKILIVDYGDIDPLTATLESGVDEIVEKPFPVTDLLDRIVTFPNRKHLP